MAKVKLAPLLLATALMTLAAEPNLMPLPAKYSLRAGRLALDRSFGIGIEPACQPLIGKAVERFLIRLDRHTGGLGRESVAPTAHVLNIRCSGPAKPIQELGEDESYTLDADRTHAVIHAATALGALHGMETFLQLVQQDREGWFVPAISIQDQPRFPWRGLMLDVSRHWMPIEVVLRTLDGMAAVKMNVFHWHLSDDQGFRVESKRYPKLNQMGSDGHYFTQAQVREVIDYAHDRGIRVVPEFDIPGHATSWLAAYPELGAAPGPYQIERRWGVFDPTLDPTKEITYEFLDGLIGEMAPLFDDRFFHIGGDEVNGKQWRASEQVQAFMKEHNLKDNHELQRAFNRRVQLIVTKYGKRMEGWDEILDPDLPKDIVIQSWRGQKSLNLAVQQGYTGLLSGGYYLDLMQSAESHYAVDPYNQEAAALTSEQRARILGGEACMWVEFATPENVDLRIWPRAAAIAERLWSPQTVTNVRSMYTRLDAIGRHLETTAGLTHRTANRRMIERLAGNDPVEPLRVLAEIVEPVKKYARSGTGKYTQFTPLNRMVDATRPESDAGRNFRYAVAAKDWAVVRKTLIVWRDNDAVLRPTLERHALLKELIPISANLTKVARIGLEALDAIEHSAPRSAADASTTLGAAQKPVAELLLMAVPGVTALVALAGSRR